MSVELSNYELWYLLSLETPTTVIGFRNPVIGMLTEDMFPIIQEVSFSLYDHGVIIVDGNSQITIKEPLAKLLHCIATPTTTLLLAYRQNDNQKENIKSFHFDGNQVVLLEEMNNGSYRIKGFENSDELKTLLSEPFLDKIFWAPDTGSLYFSRDAMTEMQKAIEDGSVKDAKEYLEQATGDEPSKVDFWNTVQSPMIRYSLVGFMDRNDFHKSNVNGFSVIADEHYVWLLELTDDEGQACASKVTLKDLNKKIGSLLSLAI